MAVRFNGSTHKLQRDAILAGVENSGKFTVSGWVWSDGVAAQDVILAGGPSGSGNFILSVTTAGELNIVCRNSAGTIIVNCTTSGEALEDSTWHHFVMAVNLSTPIIKCYIDRTLATVTESTLTASATIAFQNATRWTIGSSYSGSVFSDFALEDLLFKAGQYVDLTDADNLNDFVSSDGRAESGDKFWQNVGPSSGVKPVGYGVGAPVFNGEKADIYFSNSFQNNQGTGGEFIPSGLPFTAVSFADRLKTYRNSAHYDNKERWYDSELTGFSYTRSKTFIEEREGHPHRGLRMGIDERDGPFRQESVADTLSQLLYGDNEDDSEEWDR